jgi:hypothetical protein
VPFVGFVGEKRNFAGKKAGEKTLRGTQKEVEIYKFACRRAGFRQKNAGVVKKNRQK